MAIIVYTEDEECISNTVLPIVQKCVMQFGHTTEHFSAGNNAKEYMEQQCGTIELLITDLSLSDDIGGLRLALLSAKQGVKRVLILSSSAEENDTLQFMQRIAKNYGIRFALQNKPVDASRLTKIIEKLLIEDLDT